MDYIYATGFWVAVIAAVAGAMVTVLNGYYSAKRGYVAVARAAEAASTAVAATEKVGEIHDMLNSQRTAMEDKINRQQQQIADMTGRLAQLEQLLVEARHDRGK